MMKNRSIRFKITLWFSLALVVIVGLTFFIVYLAGGIVLRNTIRDYLISAVEENVDKIQWGNEKRERAADTYIPYKDGYLVIDESFLDVINDVHTALYTVDGTMLYGENPLARQTEDVSFTESCTWHMEVKGVRYDFYDRKLDLSLPDEGTLWIRGIVAETKSAAQLNEITRISWILLPALIALAVISGYFLTDRMLSPIREMEHTAGQISRGMDLKQRIEVGKNMDEIGRLAKVFNHMLERLEQSFEAERRFTSDASHELRTPTSVILAQCEYTLEKPRAAEDYEEALRVVQKQGRRMNALIGDMLDYTRMEQRPEQYVLDPLDLSAVVAEIAEQMSFLGTNGIELTAKIAPAVEISGNALLISRLVQNLISNAYRYGKPNGHIEVALAVEKEAENNQRAVLSVSDDGIGIAKEEQEKIFDRFYRSDCSRSIQGTGLGLSMVKKIAELHGADITVESAPGQGSSFRIIFPIFCKD